MFYVLYYYNQFLGIWKIPATCNDDLWVSQIKPAIFKLSEFRSTVSCGITITNSIQVESLDILGAISVLTDELQNF